MIYKKLKELCILKNGYAFKSKDFSQNGVPVIKIKNVKPNKILLEGLSYVPQEIADSKLEYKISKGDILITMTGNRADGSPDSWVGKVALFREEGTYLLNQRLAIIRPISDDVDLEYLAYYLSSWETQLYFIKRANSSGGQANISPSIVGEYDIALPNKNEQMKIASLLRDFDLKIRMNANINNNLEQQAQAIFKEWFIDNPENENWSNGTFSELIQSTLSGDWGKEAPTGNNTEKVYCVRGADIPEVKAGNKGKMPTRYILPKNYASKKLTAGDIVVEISGGSPTQSTGRCTAISESLLNRYDSGMVCTNFCRAIKPLSGYSMFIYYYWQYLYDKGVFFSYENGTTGIKNLDISGFLGTEPIVIPPKEKVLAFDDYCQTVFDRIFANGKESEQLSQLRDTLLPKLMSGELDVSDIDI